MLSPNPTQLLKAVDILVRMSRDVVTINFSKQDASTQLEGLKTQFQHLTTNLYNLIPWLGDGGQASSSPNSPEQQFLKETAESILRDIIIARQRIVNIDGSRKGKAFNSFPTHTKKFVDEINAKISSIKDEISKLFDRIKEFNASRDGTVPGIDGDNKFKCVEDMVPEIPGYPYFDFESTGTDGQPLTCAGKLKAAILNDDSQRRSVVAYGISGIGKSWALKAVGRQKDVIEKFDGGVLYINLGKLVEEKQLNDSIAHFVLMAGGGKRAEEIRKRNELYQAVDLAGAWFKSYRCLFLIDDLWLRGGITKGTLELLSNIAKHDGSRIPYTTQYSDWDYATCVEFTPRDSNSEESKEMLLCNAGLKYPSSDQACKAFDNILASCHGFPIELSFAGRTLRDLQRKPNDSNPDLERMSKVSNPEMAWEKYDSAFKVDEKNNDGRLTKRLLNSLSHTGPEADTHTRRFEALGVLRDGKDVPLKILSTLWNVDIRATMKEVKALENFSIVHYSISKEKVAIHDKVLEISRDCAAESLRSQRLEFLERLLSKDQIGKADEASDPSSSSQGVVLSSEEFRRKALMIKCDEYILSNLCWLLKLGEMKSDLLWLVSQPWWIVKRLNEENRREVLGDVEMASECLSDISLNAEDKKNSRDFLHRLTNCLLLSMSSIISSGHRSMPWFQLYGRMMYAVSNNSKVREFVQSIETDVPKPWMKPAYGCLPSAGGHLKTVVDTPGYVRHCVCQGERISVISWFSTELFITIHDANDGTELEREKLPINLSEYYIYPTCSLNGKAVVCQKRNRGLLLWTFSTHAIQHEESDRKTDDVEVRLHQDNVEEIETERSEVSILQKFVKNMLLLNVWKESRKAKRFETKNNCGQSTSNQACISDERVKDNDPVADDCRFAEDEISPVRCRETIEDGGRWDRFELGRDIDVNCVALSSDGKTVVSGAEDGTVRVWSNREGKWDEGHILNGHSGKITCVAISNDGKEVVSGSRDKTLRVWNYRDGKWGEGHSLTGHSGWINCVAISTDGKQVVSGLSGKTVRVWSNHEGKWDEGHSLTGHSGSIFCVAISTDGKQVASGLQFGKVNLWKNIDGKWDEGQTLTGHSASINCVSICPDGKQVVSGSSDRTVRVWNNVGEVCALRSSSSQHTNKINFVSISGDGKVVVSASVDKTIRVWNNRNGKWGEGHILTGLVGMITCVVISADGKLVAGGSKDGLVRMWNNMEGKWDNGHSFTGHRSRINCVDISTEGNEVVSGLKGKFFRSFNNRVGKRSEGHVLTERRISCVALSTNGKEVVSGSLDGTVRVWNNRDGKWGEGDNLTGHRSRVNCVAIRTDGKEVVSGLWDGTVRVWNNRDGKWGEGHSLAGHSGMIACVAISTDGKQVVCGSLYGTVRVWNNRDGKWGEGHNLTGHRRRINCVAISTDGKQVASGPRDETLRVWNNRDGKWDEGHSLTGHSGSISCVSISTDGVVKAKSRDGTGLLWRMRNDGWVLSTDGRKCCADTETRSSLPTVHMPAFDGQQRTGISSSASDLDFSVGRNYAEVEGVVEILDIGAVSEAVRADEAWTVSNGYCLKISSPPFLLFINLEK